MTTPRNLGPEFPNQSSEGENLTQPTNMSQDPRKGDPVDHPSIDASLASYDLYREETSTRLTWEQKSQRRVNVGRSFEIIPKWFEKRSLHSIVLDSVPTAERPLQVIDLQYMGWLRKQLDRDYEPEALQEARQSQLDELAARPLSREALVSIVRDEWTKDKPDFEMLLHSTTGYVKSWMALQTWPLWVDRETKQQLREEIVKRLIWEFSWHQTSDRFELMDMIKGTINQYTSFSIWQEKKVRLLERHPRFVQHGLVAWYTFMAGTVYLFARTAAQGGLRVHHDAGVGLAKPPSEIVEWQTFQQRDGRDMQAQLVRLDSYGEELVFQLSPRWHRAQDQSYEGSWSAWDQKMSQEGDQVSLSTPTPIKKYSLRPRGSRNRLAILSTQSPDACLDELPRKLVSSQWEGWNGIGQEMGISQLHGTDPLLRLMRHYASYGGAPFMGGHRYPDMEGDQIRLLWLREKVFGLCGISPTRQVRVVPTAGTLTKAATKSMERPPNQDYLMHAMRGIRPTVDQHLDDLFEESAYRTPQSIAARTLNGLNGPLPDWIDTFRTLTPEDEDNNRFRTVGTFAKDKTIAAFKSLKGKDQTHDPPIAPHDLAVLHAYDRQILHLRSKLSHARDKHVSLLEAASVHGLPIADPAKRFSPRPIGWGEERPERGVGDALMRPETDPESESDPPVSPWNWRQGTSPNQSRRLDSSSQPTAQQYMLACDLAHLLAEQKMTFDQHLDTAMRPFRLREMRSFKDISPRRSERAMLAFRADLRRKILASMEQQVALSGSSEPLTDLNMDQFVNDLAGHILHARRRLIPQRLWERRAGLLSPEFHLPLDELYLRSYMYKGRMRVRREPKWDNVRPLGVYVPTLTTGQPSGELQKRDHPPFASISMGLSRLPEIEVLLDSVGTRGDVMLRRMTSIKRNGDQRSGHSAQGQSSRMGSASFSLAARARPKRGMENLRIRHVPNLVHQLSPVQAFAKGIYPDWGIGKVPLDQTPLIPEEPKFQGIRDLLSQAVPLKSVQSKFVRKQPRRRPRRAHVRAQQRLNRPQPLVTIEEQEQEQLLEVTAEGDAVPTEEFAGEIEPAEASAPPDIPQHDFIVAHMRARMYAAYNQHARLVEQEQAARSWTQQEAEQQAERRTRQYAEQEAERRAERWARRSLLRQHLPTIPEEPPQPRVVPIDDYVEASGRLVTKTNLRGQTQRPDKPKFQRVNLGGVPLSWLIDPHQFEVNRQIRQEWAEANKTRRILELQRRRQKKVRVFRDTSIRETAQGDRGPIALSRPRHQLEGIPPTYEGVVTKPVGGMVRQPPHTPFRSEPVALDEQERLRRILLPKTYSKTYYGHPPVAWLGGSLPDWDWDTAYDTAYQWVANFEYPHRLRHLASSAWHTISRWTGPWIFQWPPQVRGMEGAPPHIAAALREEPPIEPLRDQQIRLLVERTLPRPSYVAKYIPKSRDPAEFLVNASLGSVSSSNQDPELERTRQRLSRWLSMGHNAQYWNVLLGHSIIPPEVVKEYLDRVERQYNVVLIPEEEGVDVDDMELEDTGLSPQQIQDRLRAQEAVPPDFPVPIHLFQRGHRGLQPTSPWDVHWDVVWSRSSPMLQKQHNLTPAEEQELLRWQALERYQVSQHTVARRRQMAHFRNHQRHAAHLINLQMLINEFWGRYMEVSTRLRDYGGKYVQSIPPVRPMVFETSDSLRLLATSQMGPAGWKPLPQKGLEGQASELVDEHVRVNTAYMWDLEDALEDVQKRRDLYENMLISIKNQFAEEDLTEGPMGVPQDHSNEMEQKRVDKWIGFSVEDKINEAHMTLKEFANQQNNLGPSYQSYRRYKRALRGRYSLYKSWNLPRYHVGTMKGSRYSDVDLRMEEVDADLEALLEQLSIKSTLGWTHIGDPRTPQRSEMGSESTVGMQRLGALSEALGTMSLYPGGAPPSQTQVVGVELQLQEARAWQALLHKLGRVSTKRLASVPTDDRSGPRREKALAMLTRVKAALSQVGQHVRVLEAKIEAHHWTDHQRDQRRAREWSYANAKTPAPRRIARTISEQSQTEEQLLLQDEERNALEYAKGDWNWALEEKNLANWMQSDPERFFLQNPIRNTSKSYEVTFAKVPFYLFQRSAWPWRERVPRRGSWHRDYEEWWARCPRDAAEQLVKGPMVKTEPREFPYKPRTPKRDIAGEYRNRAIEGRFSPMPTPTASKLKKRAIRGQFSPRPTSTAWMPRVSTRSNRRLEKQLRPQFIDSEISGPGNVPGGIHDGERIGVDNPPLEGNILDTFQDIGGIHRLHGRADIDIRTRRKVTLLGSAYQRSLVIPGTTKRNKQVIHQVRSYLTDPQPMDMLINTKNKISQVRKKLLKNAPAAFDEVLPFRKQTDLAVETEAWGRSRLLATKQSTHRMLSKTGGWDGGPAPYRNLFNRQLVLALVDDPIDRYEMAVPSYVVHTPHWAGVKRNLLDRTIQNRLSRRVSLDRSDIQEVMDEFKQEVYSLDPEERPEYLRHLGVFDHFQFFMHEPEWTAMTERVWADCASILFHQFVDRKIRQDEEKEIIWRQDLLKRSSFMMRLKLERHARNLKRRWWAMETSPVPHLLVIQQTILAQKLINVLTALDLQRTQTESATPPQMLAPWTATLLQGRLGMNASQVVPSSRPMVVVHKWGLDAMRVGTRRAWADDPWRVESRMSSPVIKNFKQRVRDNKYGHMSSVRMAGRSTGTARRGGKVGRVKRKKAHIGRRRLNTQGGLSNTFGSAGRQRGIIRLSRLTVPNVRPETGMYDWGRPQKYRLLSLPRIGRPAVEGRALGPGGLDASLASLQVASEGVTGIELTPLTKRRVLDYFMKRELKARRRNIFRTEEYWDRAEILAGHDEWAERVSGRLDQLSKRPWMSHFWRHRPRFRGIMLANRPTNKLIKTFRHRHGSKSVRKRWTQLELIDVTAYTTGYIYIQMAIGFLLTVRPWIQMVTVTLPQRRKGSMSAWQFKWDIQTLERKGRNNKRRLTDLIGVGDAEAEMYLLAYILYQRGVHPLIKALYWLTGNPYVVGQEGAEDLVIYNPRNHRFRIWPDSTRRMARINRLVYKEAPSMWGRVPKLYSKQETGALFTGPPGTGKTLLAQAMAGTAGIRFLGASASEFMLRGRKDCANMMRQFFAYARKQSPCIVFIDEIDSISIVRAGLETEQNFGPRRVSRFRHVRYPEWEPSLPRHRRYEHKDPWRVPANQPHTPGELQWSARYATRTDSFADLGARWYRRRGREFIIEEVAMLVQLLFELDGCRKRGQMFVIGATNRRWIMDSAVFRDGRLDRGVHIAMPDLSKRIKIMKHYMGPAGLSESVCLPYVFALSTQMSAADISACINESHLRAIFDEGYIHREKTLERGITVISSVLSADDDTLVSESCTIQHDPMLWLRVAYYRAGRAVVLRSLARKPFVATCLVHRRPRGKGANPVEEGFHGMEEGFLSTHVKEAMVVHLAGRAGQLIGLQVPGHPGLAPGQVMAYLELRRQTWDLQMATGFACRVVDNFNRWDVGLGRSRHLGFKSRMPHWRARSGDPDSVFGFAQTLGGRYHQRQTERYMDRAEEELEGDGRGRHSYFESLRGWWSYYSHWQISTSASRPAAYDLRWPGTNVPSQIEMHTDVWRHSYRSWLTYMVGEDLDLSPVQQYDQEWDMETKGWSPDHQYRRMRDIQITRMLRGAFQKAWYILEHHRSILDICAAILLGQGILRMYELGALFTPFENIYALETREQAYSFQRSTTMNRRRLDRCWITRADRFARQPHHPTQRQTVQAAMGDPAMAHVVESRTVMPIYRPAPWSGTYWGTPAVKARHQALLRITRSYEAMYKQMTIKSVHTTDLFNTMYAAIESMVQVAEVGDPGLRAQLDAINEDPESWFSPDADSELVLAFTPPTPRRCWLYGDYVGRGMTVNYGELDPWTTPGRQLEQLAARLSYLSALLPITSLVQGWIQAWEDGQMHISDLFWLLMPLDQGWQPGKGYTIQEELCAEPYRAVWMLRHRVPDVFWGQTPNLDRLQGWSRMCQGLHGAMEKRYSQLPLDGRTDAFDEQTRTLFQQEGPIPAPILDSMAVQFVDFAAAWMQQARRSQLVLNSLASQSIDVKVVATELSELAQARQKFSDQMPYLRDVTCQMLTDGVKMHALSVGLGRSLCRHSADLFAGAEEQRIDDESA